MKNNLSSISATAVVAAMFALSSCATQEEMKPTPAPTPAAPAPAAKAEPAPAKAKVVKAGGDVGLLDTEKNYMILVTKEGKLVTLDFDAKTDGAHLCTERVQRARVSAIRAHRDLRRIDFLAAEKREDVHQPHA